jgi:hypothetical protein
MLERRASGSSDAEAFARWLADGRDADAARPGAVALEVGQWRQARYWTVRVLAVYGQWVWLDVDGEPITRNRRVVECWPVIAPARAPDGVPNPFRAVSS